MRPNLINRLKEEWNNLDPVDPLRGLLSDAIDALAEQPSGGATSAQLPFGVGGGLVAIKTLLSRDPCAHAKVAIEMIDAMLSEQPAQQEPVACAQIVSLNDTQGVVEWLSHNGATLKAGDYLYAPTPAQRKPQEACPTCGEYEPRTGTCGTSPNDKRALCNRNAPQPAQQEEPVAIKWTLDGDKTCGYNNWLGETPFGRILITWKGWKKYHDACVDEFPGDFSAYGSPDEVKAMCEAEFAKRSGFLNGITCKELQLADPSMSECLKKHATKYALGQKT